MLDPTCEKYCIAMFRQRAHNAKIVKLLMSEKRIVWDSRPIDWQVMHHPTEPREPEFTPEEEAEFVRQGKAYYAFVKAHPEAFRDDDERDEDDDEEDTYDPDW